jgi:hypothetical protein
LQVLTRNRINISEKEATLLWQQLAGKVVASVDGETLGVVYPGRSSGDSGPDFRDAVIANQFHLARGDVEIHVRSSDWYSHQHHANAAYNNVVLHVVVWHDCDSATLLQSGRQVPVLSLANALRYQPYLLPNRLACSQILDRTDGQTLGKLLNNSGEQRFKQKAMHFQVEMSRSAPSELSAGQALFRGIMRALGYAKNTKPFEDLADRLPLDSIESKAGLVPKQALLLGTAGLLPSQRQPGRRAREQEVRKLEQAWRSVAEHVEPMTEHEWTFLHIYPNNSPVRRIVAQSYLLERYRARKLVAGILQLVREAPQPDGSHAIEKGLTVAAEGHWRNHFGFDARSKTEIPTVLGSSKAGEIAVNVVLPFAYSWGRVFNEPDLATKAIGLYSNYPGLADNGITRHMLKQLCLGEHARGTARLQQGLIHIFRNYCREGRCGECPLAGQIRPSTVTNFRKRATI